MQDIVIINHFATPIFTRDYAHNDRPGIQRFVAVYICGLRRQKQVSQAGKSNYIPQSTAGCNYLSLPEIPASGNKVLICELSIIMLLWMTYGFAGSILQKIEYGCMDVYIYNCRFNLPSRIKTRPGACPANDISIEFEIRPKFEVCWFEMSSTDHNDILYMLRQCNCHNMCKFCCDQ